MPHFNHLSDRHLDPRFLHEERLFLERERAALLVMERHRDHLAQDIEKARSLAMKAHIPIDHSVEVGGRKLALIGIGDRLSRDDGAGLEVARRLRLAHPPGVTILEQGGKPASLLEAWTDADEALVVDGVSSGAKPGTLHRFEVTDQPLPSICAHVVAEAIEWARELDRLPGRLVVYGIEGESFEVGESLTPMVQRAVAQLVMELYREFEGRS